MIEDFSQRARVLEAARRDKSGAAGGRSWRRKCVGGGEAEEEGRGTRLDSIQMEVPVRQGIDYERLDLV